MLAGFKKFILQGNVVDLAVGVVIGAAFKGVVDALTTGIINPLIAAIFGKPNLDNVGTFTINNANFSIGVILTAAINFLIVAAAIYFVVVLPINTLKDRRSAGEEPGDPTNEEKMVALLEQIASK